MKPLLNYCLLMLLWLFAGASQANIVLKPADQERVAAQYGKLPLSFEANRGQTDPAVRFLSRGPGYALFITPTEAVFSLRKAVVHPNGKSGAGHETHFLKPPSSVAEIPENARLAHPMWTAKAIASSGQGAANETLSVRMQLVGANPDAGVAGQDELPGKINYLRGNDLKLWQTGVTTYGKVKLNGVYNGVDLVYYGNGRQLEYDFIVAPGADPKTIRLNFSGTDNARLDAVGDLLLHTLDGELLRLQKPVVYQTAGGRRQNVDGRFVLYDSPLGEGQGKGKGKNQQVGFQVASYDAAQPLVIDPVLVYSTYLGGSGSVFENIASGDVPYSIAVDSIGNAYVTGSTLSSDFPTVKAAYPDLWGLDDAFVVKFSADGSKLLYSTYLGGSGGDIGTSIAVDNAGNAYVTGVTGSSDFPTAKAKYPALMGDQDAFVVKFSANGSKLLYSTYLGGSGFDSGIGIAVDWAGNAYVTGVTGSSDFPTAKAKYPALRGLVDAFVVKFSANGSKLLYSTYLGGSDGIYGYADYGYAITVDSVGNAYVAGTTYSSDFPTVKAKYSALRGYQDAFVVKFSANGSKLLYSTYLGGSDGETGDGIAIDKAGNAYVTGVTNSSDFPTVKAAYPDLMSFQNYFVVKFSANGSKLLYSTYLGGSGGDRGGIAVDKAGHAYVIGSTGTDAFVVKFRADGSKLLYSTYLGGSYYDNGAGIAVDWVGNAYVIGTTWSSDFPTHANNASIVSYDSSYNGSGDAFVVKLSAAGSTKQAYSRDNGDSGFSRKYSSSLNHTNLPDKIIPRSEYCFNERSGRLLSGFCKW